MNLNPNININAGRLYTALQDNSVFVKNKTDDDIIKVALELDYSTFVQLQELLSDLSPKKPTKPKTLYDVCMEYKAIGDMDFDIPEFKDLPTDFSELETLFDD
ncbi:hypothetical protein [Moraxella equi]|uniref:Uncharacterized protein n=1 Tax=Moraxella equi TaxID=60442 RepID=A0A378QS28_9GAMM|nr:hypothetical protein [Moraxella equi]OPH40203.1 hypothetical protein B5J93_00190 [Moraxella equi]STZ03699.1 Uncharacterised protein [Moraxella equi]